MCNDCYNKVISHIREELNDIEAYRELASSTEDAYLRLVLENIVQDEESHARYLANALKNSGRMMPTELWEDYSAVERSFRSGKIRKKEHSAEPEESVIVY